MEKFILISLIFFNYYLFGQIIPDNSYYNENIIWENVYTNGPAGKVNRGLVDSDGNCAVIFMPDNMSRIHKIDGENGDLIWTKTIENTVGFGIFEINDEYRADYLISGGFGSSQERWMCRLNGNDGSIMWEQIYNSSGNQYEFDGIRTGIVGSDGYIYASGFIGGDEGGTIFIVYGGQAMLMKIDPSNGQEIWTHTNDNSEYAVALVESNENEFYYGGALYDENLKLTKVNSNGQEIWTRDLENTFGVIPADISISNNQTIYYGGHTGREGDGEPFDYTCVSLDKEANVNWVNHYANPRGYSLEHIRNELYGLKLDNDGIYMFGGTGDEGYYSATLPPFESSDVWNGWVLKTDFNGEIVRSDVFCHESVNTATEYGDLTDDGFVIFNDTDAQGDTEVGLMKILANNSLNTNNNKDKFKKEVINKVNLLGQEINNEKNQIIIEIFNDGTANKKIKIE